MIGYDKLTKNQGLLLALTFEEAHGALTYDRAKPTHPMTLTGTPSWAKLANGLTVLDFNPSNPDFLQCSPLPTFQWPKRNILVLLSFLWVKQL